MCPGCCARYVLTDKQMADVMMSELLEASFFLSAPCIPSDHHNLWKIGHLHEFPLFDFVPRVHP